VKACDRYLNAIHELVDGTLGPIRRAELELHLEVCDGCRALAQDLQAIAGTARSLDALTPPDRVWQELAGRLRAEGRVSGAPSVAGRRRSVAILALAAALVLLVGSSLFVLRRETRPGAAPAAPIAAAPAAPADGNAPTGTAVQSVAAELALTERHFQNVVEQASATDPATAAVLQKNLLVMNNAIAESRKALEANPQSTSTQLYEMLKQKIRFLQDTIALMNDMRQGDAAGAAQIVEGKS
jgi:anti-sigma factor RsiW